MKNLIRTLFFCCLKKESEDTELLNSPSPITIIIDELHKIYTNMGKTEIQKQISENNIIYLRSSREDVVDFLNNVFKAMRIENYSCVDKSQFIAVGTFKKTTTMMHGILKEKLLNMLTEGGKTGNYGTFKP